MATSTVRVISKPTENLNPGKAGSLNSALPAWRRVVPFAIIFLTACMLLFAQLGKYPLFNPDEALYAEPAKEMLEICDFITTYLNYVVRFTKPPIAIWGQALGIIAFGCNEFAVRFFGAAGAAILIAATYWFVEKVIGQRAAIISSLALCTAPLFIGTARVSITDMPLSLFSASGMLCFYLFLRLRENSLLWLAYICTGLAVMTKGPVGLVLPVAILAVYHFLKQDIPQALKAYKPLLGAAIVGFISLPWFILEISITHGAYFNDFIMKENVQRYTAVVDSHKGGWWYHIAAMMGGFFPWSVFIPQAFVGAAMWDRLKKYWTNSGPFSILQSYQQMSVAEDLGLYCLCWAVITVGFFSTSVSKLIPYTLPAFPAVAILLALEFERLLAKQSTKKFLVPMSLLAVIFAVSTAVLPVALKHLRDAPETLIDLTQSFASYELIFTVAATALLARRFYRCGFYLFLLPTIVGFLFFGNRLLNVLSQTWEEPLPAMARFAGSSDLPILVYDMRKPSMPFYTGRQVIQPSSEERLHMTLRHCTHGAYILSKAKRSQYFREFPGCKIILAEGKFILVAYSPVSSQNYAGTLLLGTAHGRPENTPGMPDPVLTGRP